MSSKFIPIRFSHLLGYSGVGAIVRGPNWLGVVQDIRNWTDKHGQVAGELILYVERVRSALGITQELREPPHAQEVKKGVIDGVCIPVTRFPSWVHCPTCGAMYRGPWGKEGFGDPPQCTQGKCREKGSQHAPKLEQVTWILVDPRGYLADVDWHYLAHAKLPDPKACKVLDQLFLIDKGGKRILLCAACNARTLFYGNEWINFGFGRMQPWTKNDMVIHSGESPESDKKDLARILSVNDIRTYLPDVEIVLIIPPESRVRKGTVVDLLYRNSKDRESIDKARTPLAKKSALSQLAKKYRCSPQDIENALKDLEKGYPLYGETFTPGMLLESEFDAFLEVLPDVQDDEDFVTYDQTDGLKLYPVANVLDRLIRVDRLKAINVFQGFRRINHKGDRVPPDIVGKSNWLPAMQLYGDGLFFTLDEHKLQKWEAHPEIQKRMQVIVARFIQSGQLGPKQLTPRFLLLHTLSHLLIRQIEAEAGYPAASLTERLYCAQAPKKMAGVLIYVAVPDIAGSLGGLAELAEPRRFCALLTRALERAQWCSLDPVCTEHQGQGPGLLNRAACHACTLIPEPACEYGNVLLDRVFVKGDASIGLPSFFEDD